VNILKHMEAAFVVTVAILGSAAFVTESVPEANARPYLAPAESLASADAPIATVYVTAKRMTPEQKRMSLEQERRSDAAGRT
jgi:hypothetical protein